MPRDDLSIDFVGRRGMMPPTEHQDAATILEEWANKVANLPHEIAHMQEEIQHKDREMEDCLSIIRRHDNAIQKWIKINGSHVPNPKEKDLTRIILENYDKAQILQEEKLALAQKCQKRVDAHTRYLDAQIKVLQDRNEFPTDPDFPSLLRTPPPNHISATRSDPSVTAMPLNQIPNSASALHVRQPAPRRTIPSHIQEPAAGASSSSAPVTPAASMIAARQARESSLGAANKRQRLTGGVGIHPPGGLARQSSLGPGTPKANTPTGGARAGSAGPRAAQKTGPKKTAPTGSRQSGIPRKHTKSGLSRIKRPGKKNSPSLTNDSELSDADTGSVEEEDEAITPRNKDGEGDDDMVDVDDEEGGDDKKYFECFDPFGVYKILTPGLLPRFPLRNLHWESHAGPLRSISTLHIDLVPTGNGVVNTLSADPISASTTSLSRVKSEDSTASGDDGFQTQSLGQIAVERPESQHGPLKPPVKERRHQIPGLRQTPYLKIFLLRCDDNENYKAQARPQIREWIKQHTASTQSSKKLNSQENHDAFEWMIVHVILPNTPAATQPRVNGKGAEGSSGSIAEKAGPRWRGGSSTIFEKLRADFNGSSKSGIDRVAQVRIGVEDVPYDMLPRVSPAVPGSFSETPQENENSWLDLISKLKFLILSSFDMRVSQYEEDIREKDAQRSLPGWNFCTFFVLKEGLARGFESVGLVEDSLVGYDELAVGLDAIVKGQSTETVAQHGASFLPFTEDLKRQAERVKQSLLKELGTTEETDDPIDLQSNIDGPDHEASEIPLNATKKNYRELILANNISVFDFRCYLFARQLSLLLRLANAWSSKEELLAKLKEQREASLLGLGSRPTTSQPSDDAENLVVLAEICKRSMDFVSSISGIMRDDIWNSQTTAKQTSSSDGEVNIKRTVSDPIMMQIVDNIVSSFTFAITQQILAQTATKALPIPPSTLAPPSSNIALDGQEPKAAIPEPKTMMHPARTSSLAIRSRSREPPSPGLFPGGRRASVPEQGATTTSFLKPGLEELAARRAELYLLSRSVLQRVGMERGWTVGWEEVAALGNDELVGMEEIDLSQDSNLEVHSTIDHDKISPSCHGIDSKLLRTALDNKEDFYRLYEIFTDKALRHHTVANHMQSVQASMADLAVLKYHLKDHAAAASYFYRITPSYGEDGWGQVELSMLIMYTTCLKELQRKEEYVRVVLKLLTQVAAAENEKLSRKSLFGLGGRNPTPQKTQQMDTYLPELFEITKSLHNIVVIPLQNFFAKIEIDDTVQYHSEMDSIGLQVRLQYLLTDDLNVEKARVRIVSTTGDSSREIWLETDSPIILEKGTASLLVQTNTIVPGTYVVDFISLHTSNVNLQYDHGASGSTTTKADSFFKCPRLLIYQREEAFDVRLFSSRYMHLDRNRSLEFELSPGWNNVIRGQLHLRAATAGLRLQTSETKVAHGSLELYRNSEAGIIKFGALEASSITKLTVPFNLEHEVNDLSIKLELTYTTENGTFTYAATPSVSISLPLGVNVQDVFKHKALFSKFTISSATSSPLRLLRSRLQSSEVFEASGGATLDIPLVIFPRQPATMAYKIKKDTTRPAPPSEPRRKLKSSLSLILDYTCLDEEIEKAITDSLQEALRESIFHSYERVIVPTVIRELGEHLPPYELERVAILGELSTSILSSSRWREHFLGLGRTKDQNKEVAVLLEEFLQAWIEKHPKISVGMVYANEETHNKIRSIMIPVDVPSVSVVHTAELKLSGQSLVSSTGYVAVTNQPIPASLDIKWTRIWDTEIFKEKSIQDGYIEFFYEVTAHSDTWIIGGKRKGHFRVSKGTSEIESVRKIRFQMLLIPLREGFLPFPTVDIKPVKAVNTVINGSEHESNRDNPPVTCETDYKNAGEVIRVINDSRKTTVSLDASGPLGGAMLLESEQRVTEGTTFAG